MWDFLLNSSRLLKNFRKKYNMSCHVMHPMQDYFWKIFHMHDKLICNIYALLYWQKNYSCKSGCYIRFGDLCLKIIATVSWFGPQNQADYGLLIAPQN
jgi:hypothetical protein